MMNGNRRRQVLVGVALVFAGAAFYLWRAGIGSGTPRPEVAAAATRAAADLSPEGSTAHPKGAAARGAGDGSAVVSPMVALELAQSTRNLDAELMRKALAGDTRAMAAVLELGRRCGPFWPDRGDRYHPRHEAAQSPPGTPERAVRDAAAKVLAAYCDRIYAPGETRRRGDEFVERLREAAKNGDLAAQAYFGFEGEDEVGVLSAALESKEPWIAERALMNFSTSQGLIAKQIDSEVFSPNSMMTRAEALHIKQNAARWRACTMGAACGPNQYHELSMCLYLSNCGQGLSVQAFIQRRELSGRQFELMQKYLAALNARSGGG